MPAVSIIMTVYNTENYVGKAIESILNQTFKDFEFLIIENGSTDNSKDVIEEYAIKDERIQVIFNEHNLEIAEALNMALQLAKGRYIYIADSDDYVLSSMIETMYDKAVNFDAELVYTGFFMDYCINGKLCTFEVLPEEKEFTQQEFRNKAVDDLTRTLLTVYWNKLYSLEYLREKRIKFRVTKMTDHHFNMDVIKDVKRVISIKKPLYHYNRMRSDSTIKIEGNLFLNQKKRDHMEHIMQVYKYWGISDEITMGKLADYHLGRLIQCIVETVTDSKHDFAYKRKELRVIFEDKWTIFSIENHSRKPKYNVFSFLVKSQNVFLCCLIGQMIFFIQKCFPRIFYTMRANIAQNARHS